MQGCAKRCEAEAGLVQKVRLLDPHHSQTDPEKELTNRKERKEKETTGLEVQQIKNELQVESARRSSAIRLHDPEMSSES